VVPALLPATLRGPPPGGVAAHRAGQPGHGAAHGSSSNGGCQFNNNTINSGPGFDRGELPFRSGRGFHRGDVPFLGLIITDLMRRCLDQLNHQGGGSGRRRSND